MHSPIPSFGKERRRDKHRGFSLVEVSLALLVVSVGVLGAFALIPAGLSTNRIAIEETQSAMFAETVFNGLRAQARMGPWSSIPSAAGQLPFAWPGTVDRPVYSSTIAVKVNQPIPLAVVLKSAANPNIQDLGLKYKIAIKETLPNRVKRVQLEIWPGEFADTTTNAYLFVTEILNTAP